MAGNSRRAAAADTPFAARKRCRAAARVQARFTRIDTEPLTVVHKAVGETRVSFTRRGRWQLVRIRDVAADATGEPTRASVAAAATVPKIRCVVLANDMA